jgi:hypothetical protein
MPTLQQIETFKKRARAAGYSEPQITAEIARKQQEESIKTTQKPAPASMPTPPTTPAASTQPQQQPGLLQKVAGAVVKPAVNYGKFVAEAGAQAVRAVKGDLGNDDTNKKIGDLYVQSKSFIDQAKRTKDKKEKARLLKLSRDIDSQISKLGDEAAKIGSQKSTFFEDEKNIASRGKILETGARRTAGAASYVVPGGKGVVGAMKAGALVGGLSTASEDDTGLTDIAKGAAFGAAASGTMAGAGKVIKGAAGKVGKIASDSGDKLAVRSLRPSPSQQAKFFKETGEKMVDFIKKNKLQGADYDGIYKKIKPLQKSFDDVVENADIEINSNDILSGFSDEITRLQKSILPAEKQKAEVLQTIAENFINEYGDKPINAKVITALRREIDESISNFAMDQAVKGPLNHTRDVLQGVIRDVADKAGIEIKGKSLKESGVQLSKLYKLLDISEKQQFLGQGSLPLGITTLLGGAAGGVFGLPGGIASAVAVNQANNPKVVGAASRALTAVGNKLTNQTPVTAGEGVGYLANQVAGRTGAGLVTEPENADNEAANDETAENLTDQSDLLSTDTIPQNDTAPQSHPIFGNATKQEILLDAFKKGLSQKELDELESIYDKFAQEENEGELSDTFLETGEPTTRADRMWMLENPDKVPGAKGKATEKERMFENAGFAAQQALDLLKAGKVSSGVGQGVIGQVGEKIGTNSKEQQRYRASVALARTTARNALLGANMTEKELESIQAFIPEYNDAPKIAQEKLETFIELMNQFSGM